MFKFINFKRIKNITELQEIITLYNANHPEQRVSIVPEKRNVSELFVCSYDEDKVGLFRTINWADYYGQRTGIIFLGIDTNHIGLKTVWGKNQIWHEPNFTKRIYNHGTYNSTCHMHDAVAFEELRSMMRQEGLLQDYELGFASSKEILQVLDYATEYFKKEQLGKEERQK